MNGLVDAFVCAPLVIARGGGVEAHDLYLKLTKDCGRQLSFSAEEKMTTAMRMLALGTTANSVVDLTWQMPL